MGRINFNYYMEEKQPKQVGFIDLATVSSIYVVETINEENQRTLRIKTKKPSVLRERDKMCVTDHNPNPANQHPSANGNGTRRSSVSPDTVLNLEQ